MHKKKSAPREKWEQSVFNIPYFSFSAPLPRFTFPSLSLPACLVACECMQKTVQHCFYILLSRGFARPSHPSNSPTYFTFLPVKTSTSRCCYLPGFQQPVTSTSFSLLQKLSPASLLDVLPLRLLVPAGRCSRRCQTLCGGRRKKKRRSQRKGQSDGRREGGSV